MTPVTAPRRTSLSLSPLHSPALDALEDDRTTPAAVERTKRAAEKFRRQVTPTLRRVSVADLSPIEPQSAGPQPVSDEELKQLVTNCVQIARENKINKRNLWSLKLIEHMPDLIRQEDSRDHPFDFKRVAVGLDAAVQIYSMRVDSAHSLALEAQGRARMGNRKNPEATAGDNDEGGMNNDDDDDNDESQTQQRATQRRAHTSETSTLAENFEAISSTENEYSAQEATWLQRKAGLFDAGGYKGLLMLNFGVSRGYEILMDPTDQPDGPPTIDCHQPHYTVDFPAMESIVEILDRAPATPLITPSLSDYYEIMGEQRADPTNAQNVINEAISSMASQSQNYTQGSFPAASFQCNLQNGVETQGDAMEDLGGDFEGPQFDTQNDFNANINDDDDDDNGIDAGFDGGFNDDDDDTNSAVGHWLNEAGPSNQEVGTLSVSRPEGVDDTGDGEKVALLDDDCIQWLMGGGIGARATRKTAWTGNTHWKYMAPPKPTQTEDQAPCHSARPAARSRRPRTDYTNLPELDLENAYDLPTKKSDVQYTRRRKVNSLLPEDHHIEATFMTKLMLKPNAPLSMWAPKKNPSNLQNTGQNSMEGGGHHDFDIGHNGDNGFNDDDDDDNGGFGFDAWGENGGDGGDGNLNDGAEIGPDGLVNVPDKVQEIQIDYARKMKHVDIQALKTLLMSRIQELHAENGAEKLSLHDVVATIPEFSQAGKLEDLSIHVCFISILHLAHEHNFFVEGNDDITEVFLKNALAE